MPPEPAVPPIAATHLPSAPRLAGMEGNRFPLACILRSRSALLAGLAAFLATALLLADGLDARGRVALFAFGLALLLWTGTRLPAAAVALGTALLAVLGGAAPQDALLESLGNGVVWLMIGAFMLGHAIRVTGLADRLTALVAGQARSVGGLLWLVTFALVPLALLIPSTSARAAIALPVLRPLAEAADDPRVTRALMLLAPVVILLSTTGSLVGAGSHLMANEILAEAGGARIGFAAWMLYGLPFAAMSCAMSCVAIGWLFLDRPIRQRPLQIEVAPPAPLGRPARTTLGIGAGMVLLWLGSARHALDPATVAVLGALALTLPGFGPLSWKEAVGGVAWDLVIFVAAALVLGEALIATGAAAWLLGALSSCLGLHAGSAGPALLAGIAVLSLTAHLAMTSHAARTAALLPPVLLLAEEAGLPLAAVAFVATIGIDYCLTTPVSSKALLMFQEEGGWRPSDLLRLSALLLPAHLLLIGIFTLSWWRWVGLLP
ncbi:SLC13 family permease [Falsiroseomonas sp. E2-1-a20]|uniref:SLC13 family permease n=1 Tax=Falsiroseomonas sp. E2-1-a20 TaxID=3239300 RepID=UPI003F33A56F